MKIRTISDERWPTYCIVGKAEGAEIGVVLDVDAKTLRQFNVIQDEIAAARKAVLAKEKAGKGQ